MACNMLLGRVPGGFIGASSVAVCASAHIGLSIAAIVAVAVILSLYKFSLPVNKKTSSARALSRGFSVILPLLVVRRWRFYCQQRCLAVSRRPVGLLHFSSTIAMVILAITGLLELKHLWLSLMLGLLQCF